MFTLGPLLLAPQDLQYYVLQWNSSTVVAHQPASLFWLLVPLSAISSARLTQYSLSPPNKAHYLLKAAQ